MPPRSETLYGQCFDIFLSIEGLRRKIRNNNSNLAYFREQKSIKERRLNVVYDALTYENSIYWREIKNQLVQDIKDLEDGINCVLTINRMLYRILLEFDVNYDIGSL